MTRIDPKVTEQYKNPLPADPSKLSPNLLKIHNELIALSKDDNRGPKGDALSKSFKPFDYFLPRYKCFVEFDEQQHFTLPRLKSLELYPKDAILGFDKVKWMKLCSALKRSDNDPPYRNEQRAWLDSVRDLGPQYHGELFGGSAGIKPTVRIYEGEMEFCNFPEKTEEFIQKSVEHNFFNE